jgi:uncharacterized membrane protein (DUF485 family)
MKSTWILFFIALLVSAIILPTVYIYNTSEEIDRFAESFEGD